MRDLFTMEDMITTNGISSITNETGERCPVSAAEIKDKEMGPLIKESGADSFFTLLRYNAPEHYDPETTRKSSEKYSSVSSQRTEDSKEAVDIIKEIFQPRIWDSNDQVWIRTIDLSPASREDIKYLTSQLNKKLLEHMAQKTGICQKRRELFTQLFEELIRQDLLTCKEKGILLLRIKNEQKQTLLAYQTLFESGLNFGNRKMGITSEEIDRLELKAEQIKHDIESLKMQVDEWKKEIIRKEKEIKDQRTESYFKHKEDLKKINMKNFQLKMQMTFMPPQFINEQFAKTMAQAS